MRVNVSLGYISGSGIAGLQDLHAFKILTVLAKFTFQRDSSTLHPYSVESSAHFPLPLPQWIEDFSSICQSVPQLAPQFPQCIFNYEVGCPVRYIDHMLFFLCTTPSGTGLAFRALKGIVYFIVS